MIPEKDLLTLCGDRDQRITELSKHGILSNLESFFDPIRYTSPFILKGKLIFQELSKTEPALLWDDKVPTTIVCKWRRFMKTTETLRDLSIP